MTSIQIQKAKQAINDSNCSNKTGHYGIGEASHYLCKCWRLGRLLSIYMAHLKQLIVLAVAFYLIKIGTFTLLLNQMLQKLHSCKIKFLKNSII